MREHVYAVGGTEVGAGSGAKYILGSFEIGGVDGVELIVKEPRRRFGLSFF